MEHDNDADVWFELETRIDVGAWNTAQCVLSVAFDEIDENPIEYPLRAAAAQERRMDAIERANEWLGLLEDGAADLSPEQVLRNYRRWIRRAHAQAPEDLRPLIARILPEAVG